ncbi:MAG: SDR family oxidoreductase [Myxococcota bacterium]
MIEPRVFLVTGCASGIGRHLAGAIARRGDRVLATDVNAQGLDAAAKADGWDAAQVARATLDVRDERAWEAAVARALEAFGRLDVLLNVAGYLKPGYSHQLDAAEVDRHFDINAKGVVHGVRVVGRHFVAQRAGHVVNIGSLASMAPVPGLCLYSASKFAVRGFTLAAAQELAPHGVKVTLVMPDAVQTPMLDLQVGYEEAAMTFSGSNPLTVGDIERALFEVVLPKAPLELPLPFTRGALARLSTFLPAAVVRLAPLFTKKGRARQEALKKGG